MRHNDGVTRTTIMADETLLARLRTLAREQGVSLGEVIRQGMEMRAGMARPDLSFVGAVCSADQPHTTARDAGHIQFRPTTWR